MKQPRGIHQTQNTIQHRLAVPSELRFALIVLIGLGLTFTSFIFACDDAWAADHFACFDTNQCGSRSLSSSLSCLRNRDYTITTTSRNSEVVVLSIHGGGIEPMTSEISQTLANQNGWSRYDFKAHGQAQCLEQRSNFDTLHITATQFDDPDAIALVKRHAKAIAIHGARELPQGTICVGGRNRAQIRAFINFVNRNNAKAPYPIEAIDAPKDSTGECAELEGTSSRNIVNRNANRAGLQLELSRSIRQDLVKQNTDAEALRQVIYGAIAAAMSSTSVN